MKIQHLANKQSAFSPLEVVTPEHRRRKVPMEEDRKIDSLEERGLRRGRFIRAVRAVLFHIKLRSRNREKRIGSEPMRRSISSFSFRFRKQKHDSNESKSDLPKSASTHSTSPSIFSSLSSSSRLSFQFSEPRTSISSVMVNNQIRKPQKQSSFKEEFNKVEKQGRSGSSIMIGLVLILMSLGLTILWGKVWAIAFNAMWLACVRQKWNLRGSELRSGDVEESVKDVRRRVIMEGLPDRNHHHHHLGSSGRCSGSSKCVLIDCSHAAI